ncbi:MAG: hypothetical protein CVV50_05435 [Spirochaetae bacterium HGW-Spirochaetae-6]|jgi:nitroreductase|nr:MAG: hypothetical protein CVV50_05435 [Spirochaetae bacterium HGW-Spirochaetae-6]
MKLQEIIEKRRSIRAFTAQKVTKTELDSMVDAGLWAPSGTNLQAWQIVVVQNEEKLTQLKALSAAIFEEYTRTKLERIFKDKPHIVDVTASFSANLGGATSAVLVFIKRFDLPAERDIALASGAALIENMLLKATELELGACWMSDIMQKSSEVAWLFEVDAKNYELLGLLPVGKPEKWPRPIPRQEGRVKYFL